MGRTLHWFRVDLRVEDNRALHSASVTSDRGVVGVFLLAPAMWKEHDEAPVKIEFLLRNLCVLMERLQTRGIPLLIREALQASDAADALLKVAEECDCDAISFNLQHEFNERQRDEAVAKAFVESGRSVLQEVDQTVVDPDSVRTNDGGFYSVYSPFKRKVLSRLFEDGPPEPVGLPRKQDDLGIESDDIPDKVDGFSSDVDQSIWPAGEAEAKKRLTRFLADSVEAYKNDRDYPAKDATSVLSPYLAIGAISARLCLHGAIEANDGRLPDGKDGVSHWVSELLWRDFYRHVLVGYPRVSKGRAFKEETENIDWRESDSDLEAWKKGETGVPIVDAAIRQMLRTGWMHNRLRMVAAMFLTKDLLLNWRAGERFFMQNLIDGDLANNNGGWQWSASTGTDAAPYFRIFNPYSQSKKFDPDGEFIREYVPELTDVDDKAIHDPSSIPGLLRNELDYPEPIVDHSKARKRAIEAFEGLKAG